MDYDSIAHEANVLFKLVIHEAERSNWFSINLLIGQIKDVQIKLLMKSSDIIAKRSSLLFLIRHLFSTSRLSQIDLW